MICLSQCYRFVIEQGSIGHLNGSLQTILMRSFLLKLENIQRFCQQCFSAQILFFAVPGYFFRILGNHLRTVNDIHDKLIHLFLHLAIWHLIS